MPGAGQLRERLRFDERPTTPDDGYGNREGGWRVRFEHRCRVRPLIGSETVIAGRLQGIQPVRITLRVSEWSKKITTGWRAVDMRDEKRIFNITSPPANIDEKNRYFDVMAEIGKPT